MVTKGAALSLCYTLILSLTLLASVGAYVLDPKKVVYLDKVDFNSTFSNYLFRGNEPATVVNGERVVAYSELLTYLNASAAASGVTLPSDYYIIDIKIIYWEDPWETSDVHMEQKYFLANPQEGEIRVDELFGDLRGPGSYSQSDREARAAKLSTWQKDNLPVTIPALRKLLETKGQKPIVIYFHCECGCDRTGEMAGAYAMKYLNKTYTEVMDWDDTIAGRHILINHQWAVEWYCLYLELVEKMQLGCKFQ